MLLIIHLSEKEAKGKTCHLTMGSAELAPCLGAGCMAWGWEEEEDAAQVRAALNPDDAGRVGYCLNLVPPWRRDDAPHTLQPYV